MTLNPVLSDVLRDPAERLFGEFLPSELPILKLWTRFNQGITVTGSGVSQWDDQSGNGNHLLQATDANRPSKEADGSILGDGITQFLKADAFALDQPDTVFILGRQITWASNRYMLDGHTNNNGIIRQKSGGISPEMELYAGATIGDISPALGTYSVITGVFNGASSILQLNNDTPITGNAGGLNPNGFTLFSRSDGAAAGNFQAKEIVVSAGALDAVTRAKVVNYLAKVGGLLI